MGVRVLHCLHTQLANFSLKGQGVNISHTISTTTVQLCCHSVEVSIDNTEIN